MGATKREENVRAKLTVACVDARRIIIKMYLLFVLAKLTILKLTIFYRNNNNPQSLQPQ
jgi:hypothetical protein